MRALEGEEQSKRQKTNYVSDAKCVSCVFGVCLVCVWCVFGVCFT